MATTTAKRNKELEELDDAELLEIASASATDTAEEAWQILYDRLHPQLMGWAVKKLDRPDAKDLVARTFERIYRHAHRYKREEDGGLPVANWAFVIISNLRKNVRRNDSRRPVEDATTVEARQREDMNRGLFEVTDSADLGPNNRLMQPEPQPDQYAEAGELWDAVGEVMEEEMSAEHAATLRLRMKDIPYVEAAEELGIPVGSYKSKCHRARKKLLEGMRERGFEPGEIINLD